MLSEQLSGRSASDWNGLGAGAVSNIVKRAGRQLSRDADGLRNGLIVHITEVCARGSDPGNARVTAALIRLAIAMSQRSFPNSGDGKAPTLPTGMPSLALGLRKNTRLNPSCSARWVSAYPWRG